MSKSSTFLLGLASALVGVGFERLSSGIPAWAGFSVAGVGLLFLFGRVWPVWVWIACLGIGLGFGRAALVAPLPVVVEGQREIVGTIVDAPDVRRDRVKYTIDVEAEPVFRMLVSAALEPRFSFGDRMRFSCFVRRPEPIETFAYDRYLALDGISATCSARRVEFMEGGGWSFGRMLASGRSAVERRLNELFPEPEASFAAGLLIGSRRGLPDEVKDAFNRTGTTHLIALSGFNITIVTTMIMRLMIGLVGRRKAFWFVLFGVSAFVLFVGAQPSIVRAGIMGLIAAFAQFIGRPSRGLNALVFSASLMVMLQPAILLDDVSFQLSFSATLGLMLISPVVEPWGAVLPSRFGLRENLTATVAATLGTLPVILATFGRLSLVALPVNLLILPFIPLAMGLIFLAWAASWLGLSVGLVAGVPAWLVLHGIVAAVRFFAAPAWSSFDLGALGPLAYLLTLPIFGGAVWLGHCQRKRTTEVERA